MLNDTMGIQLAKSRLWLCQKSFLEKKEGNLSFKRLKHTKSSAMCGPHVAPDLKIQEKYLCETGKETYYLTSYLTILGILLL